MVLEVFQGYTMLYYGKFIQCLINYQVRIYIAYSVRIGITMADLGIAEGGAMLY